MPESSISDIHGIPTLKTRQLVEPEHKLLESQGC
jgi:hypothetical protein